jgi:hypothetical protein
MRVFYCFLFSALILFAVAIVMVAAMLGAVFPHYGIPALIFVWVVLAWALHASRWLN